MYSDAHPSPRHVTSLLPDYVNGTLSAVASQRVRAHLARCAACREEALAWAAIAGATQATNAAPFAPSPELMARVWATIDASAIAPSPAPVAWWRHHWQILWRQTRLLNPVIWLTCLVAIIFVTYVASQQALATNADLVLSAGLPLISAVGIAFLYGPEIDPLLELAVATPASPRWIFFSRWMLLFSFNLVLSLLATLVLAMWQGQPLWAIMSLWLGPMALLATLSALIALVINPVLAALSAFLIWTTRFVQFGDNITFLLTAPPRWQTNPATLLLAGVLLALALYVVGRQERLA